MPILGPREGGQLLRHSGSLTVVPSRLGNQSAKAAGSFGQSGVVVAQAHGVVGQSRLPRDGIDEGARWAFIHDGILSEPLIHVVKSPGH